MKGDFDQKCNRTSCNSENARYYNFSTRKYYCAECARIINFYNDFDAIKLYGHSLCIKQDKPIVTPYE